MDVFLTMILALVFVAAFTAGGIKARAADQAETVVAAPDSVVNKEGSGMSSDKSVPETKETTAASEKETVTEPVPAAAIEPETAAKPESAVTTAEGESASTKSETTELVVPAGEAVITSEIENGAETITSESSSKSYSNKGKAAATDGSGTTTDAEVNAIQAAVDAAVKDIKSNTNSMTITVDSGTYNGDITISSDAVASGVNVSDDFALYILAKDSYTMSNGKMTIGNGSSGTAVVNGNLSVSKINVILAGIYFSLNDTMTVKDAALSVYGSAKADNISVIMDGTSSVDISSGAGDDSVSISAGKSAKLPGASASGNHASIDTGAGNDLLSIDVSLGGAVSKITADAGEGAGDRLNFTGALKKDSVKNQVSAGSMNFTLENSKENTIEIASSNFEQFTDSLANKASVTITSADIDAVTNTYVAKTSFTDYNYSAEKVDELIVKAAAGTGLVLSNLILSGGKSLTIGNISAALLNLVLKASEILITGKVEALNVTMTASDDDTLFDIKAPDNAVTEKLNISDKSVNISFFDVVSAATIIIQENAEIDAFGAVTMTAKSTQAQAMIPLVSGINFVSVKVGKATIDIRGAINAAGSVKAAAGSSVTLASDNSLAAKFFIPIAVGVVVNETGVTLSEDGSITSGASIDLSADSAITLSSTSTTGKIPVSLAVSVVVSDVYAKVLGSINAAGNVNIKAKDISVVTTKASKGSGTTSSSFGGFFAFGIVIQNCEASVTGDGNIKSLADVTVNATSTEKTSTTATSAAPVKANGDKTGDASSVSSIKNTVVSILKKTAGKMLSGTSVGNSKLGQMASDKLGLAVTKVDGSDGYAVSCDATTNGSMTAPAKAMEGNEVAVTVTPDKGYELSALTYTYLPAGEKASKTSNIDISKGGTSFKFTMPGAAVMLVAVFAKKSESAGSDAGIGDLFNEPDDTSEGVDGLLDKASDSSSTTSDPTKRAEKGTTGAYDVKFEDTMGGVLYADVTKADAGKEVLIHINPGKNYQIKANSVKATTTLDDSRSSVTTITPNDAGEYVWTMLKGNVTIKCEWEQAASTEKSKASSSQITGALAVSVSKNTNKAYLDTTGSVSAAGKVTVNADGVTSSATLADASPVGEEAKAAEADTSKGNENVDEVTYAKKRGIVTIATTTNGKIDFVSESTPAVTTNAAEKTSNEVVFSVTPRDGYVLDIATLKVTLTYTNDKGIQTVIMALTGTANKITKLNDGNYKFTIALADGNILGSDTAVAISASFTANPHTAAVTAGAGTDGKTHGSASIDKTSALAGQTITLTIVPEAGYKPSFTAKNGAETLNLVFTAGENNQYTFTMPDSNVSVSVAFIQKSAAVSVSVTGGDLTYIETSDSRANTGDTVTLKATQTAELSGKSISAVTVKIGTKTVEAKQNDEGAYAFTIPTLSATDKTITVTVTFSEKKFAVTLAAMTNGTVKTESRVDSEDTMFFTPTPNAGYKLKDNTLRIKVVDGSVTVDAVVEKNASGAYSYKLAKLTSESPTITISAEFETDLTNGGTTKALSLGVGVAVAVTKHANEAYIKSGNVTAKNVTVTAVSGNEVAKIASSAISKAGYSSGSIGIGGAVTVHVASARTFALIGSDAVVTLNGGSLIVKATSVDSFKTEASAISSENSGKVGIGAGVAVAVTGADVAAGIDNSARVITTETLPAVNLDIEAIHTGTESVTAKAGSAGGVSVTPALALLVSGIYVNAYLGSGSDPVYMSGDLTISAANTTSRTMTADAAAAGASVAAGGAFGISVVNDSVKSYLGRSVKKSANVKVNTTSKSTMKSTVKAGANGTREKKKSSSSDGGSSSDDGAAGEADAQADKGIKSGSALAGSAGTKNVNSNSVNSLSAGRQKASTSEGSVDIAAAFALNIQKNTNESYIAGGIDINADDSVSVLSYNETDAEITANGSASNSKVGVGVAVALNIVTFNNLAHIDDASVQTKNLSVSALMVPGNESAAKANSSGSSDESPLEKVLKEAFNSIFNELADKMGLGDLFATRTGEGVTLSDFLSDLLSDMLSDAANTLLSGTGLEKLLSTNLDEELAACIEKLPENLKTSVTDEVKTTLKEAILAKLAEKLKNFDKDFFNKKASADTPKDKAGNVDTTTNTEAAAKVSTSYDTVLRTMTDNIVNDLFGRLVDVNALKAFFQQGAADKLLSNAKTALANMNKALTTAALDAVTYWCGTKLTAEKSVPTNNIITTAIAGAGAGNVGVAGSVAVAVVNGTAKAYLDSVTDSGKYPVIALGDIALYSKIVKKEETTATASVKKDGSADKNLEAGASDTADQAASDSNGSSEEMTAGESTDSLIKIDELSNGKITFAKNGKTIELTVTPNNGYKISANSVTATVKDKDGKTVKTLPVVVLLGTYNFNISSLTTGQTVFVTAKFEGKTSYTITADPAVKVTTEKGNKTAAEGERISASVTIPTGKKIAAITYAGDNDAKKTALILDNANTNTYVFTMPAFNVTITVTFADTTETKQAVNNSGKSVGVGASFALTDARVTSESGIGALRTVMAAAADIQAEADHNTETVTVAGTDPIKTDTSASSAAKTSAENISLDASAAVNIIMNMVRSYVEMGVVLMTSGNDTITVSGKTAAADEVLANFRMTAIEQGKTLTNASCFACGSQSAIGAAVTVNIIDSDVKADFLGIGAINGSAYINAFTFNKDDSKSFASALGEDMSRYIDKINKTAGKTQTTANKTASGINTNLDKNSNSESAASGVSDKKADNNLSLSQNVLRTQDTKTESTDATKKTKDKANAAITNNTGSVSGTAKSPSAGNQTTTASSVQLAAAVAVNITLHKALVNLEGSLRAKNISMISFNAGNFRALATGAAVSEAAGSDCIAAAVAVSVNKNQSKTIVNGSAATAETMFIEAELTQNLDDNYRGYLGAQAIAGAGGGSGGASAAGAVSIIVSKSETLAEIAKGIQLNGGAVIIGAFDKSKLAVRAGAVSASKGTNVGIGASFALVYAHNSVFARVDDGVSITADSFTLMAEKKRVDFSDYSNQFGLDDLITSSEKSSAVKESKEGFVHLTKDTDNNSYSVKVNISSDRFLNSLDLLNFLSSVNYYAEAIAGGINTGTTGEVSASGSVAMVFIYTETKALVGKGVTIHTKGDTSVKASENTTSRIISGALSGGPSKTGVGLTIGFLYDNGATEAVIDSEETNKTFINAGGAYTQIADTRFENLVITAAAAAASGTGATANIGGALDVVASNHAVNSEVKDYAVITAENDLNIQASLDDFLMLASVSISGGKTKTAVGGTVAVIITNNKTMVIADGGVTLTSNSGSVSLKALSKERLFGIMASASAAYSASASNTSVAGTACVIITDSDVIVDAASSSSINADKNINITSEGDFRILIPALSASVSSTAIGAVINVVIFSGKVSARVEDNCKLTAAKGSIVISALQRNWILMISVAAGASKNSAVSGTIPVAVGQSVTEAYAGRTCAISAGDSIGVMADLDSRIYLLAGSVAVGLSKAGIGASVITTVLRNDVSAEIGDTTTLKADAIAYGAGGILTGINRSVRRSGILISAFASDEVVQIAVSGAASSGVSVGGVVSTLIIKNKVSAKTGKGVKMTSGQTGSATSGNIALEASDESNVINLAGAVSASASGSAIGATVVTVVFDKTVSSETGEEASTTAGNDIKIAANTRDDIILLAVTAGVSGSGAAVSAGGNILIFEDEALSKLGGIIVAGGNVTVSANTDDNLYNIGLSASASGMTGVSGVAVVTYFSGTTKASLRAGSELKAYNGEFSVIACSNEFITSDCAGISGGGTAGISGAVDVIITKLTTIALLEDNTSRTNIYAGTVTISSKDTYKLIGAAVSLAAAGTAGVGVTAIVTVSKNTVTAGIGKNYYVRTTSGNMNVSALCDRNISTYAGSASAGGTVGTGAVVMVTVIGGKLEKEASDELNKYFDISALMDGKDEERGLKDNASASASDYYANYSASAIKQDLEPDTYAYGDTSVGHQNSDGTMTYSGTSDYEDADYADNYNGNAGAENADKAGTANLLNDMPVYVPKNTVMAYIDEYTIVSGNKDINVTSIENTVASMITASVGAGGVAGIGVGVAVAILNSNVLAYAAERTTLSCDSGNINIIAESG